MSEQAWSSSLNIRLKEEHVSNLNKEILNLESELEKLQKQNNILTEELKKERECVDYYASFKHEQGDSELRLVKESFQFHGSPMKKRGEPKEGYNGTITRESEKKVGGKKARETQKARQAIKEVRGLND